MDVLKLSEVKARDFAALEKKLDLKFKDQRLLVQAFVHRSYLNEHHDFPLPHNERLEFLGDAVIELIVTEYLFEKYSNPEGELTSWRAALVNAKMLASIAYEVGMEPYLFLSHGEQKDAGTKARDVIMANTMESVTGAIYLDQGFKVSEKFISQWVLPKLPYVLENGLYTDAKSRFQEAAQENLNVTPNYRVVEEVGPDHAKNFKVGIYLGKELVATGDGLSKQEAQTEAAEMALQVKGWKVATHKPIKRKTGDPI